MLFLLMMPATDGPLPDGGDDLSRRFSFWGNVRLRPRQRTQRGSSGVAGGPLQCPAEPGRSRVSPRPCFCCRVRSASDLGGHNAESIDVHDAYTKRSGRLLPFGHLAERVRQFIHVERLGKNVGSPKGQELVVSIARGKPRHKTARDVRI